MADVRKILEGRWDCRYCGTKGIRGSRYNCPSCGHTRDADVQFYLTEDAKEAEDQNTEQDWECQFCGSLVKASETVCPNCSHSRMESDKKYFEAHQEAEEQKKEEAANSEPKPPAEPEKTSGRKRGVLLPILLVAVVGLFILSTAIRGRKQDLNARVADMMWEFTTYTQEYVQVEDKGWTLPADAELMGTREEVRSYNQVLVGYETKTRTVYDTVTEYESYEVQHDLGNGNFEIVTETRPVTVQVPRTETYQEPVYEQVPIYDTMYYYKIWRWRTGPPLVERGSYPEEGRFAQMERSDTVRASGYDETYYLTLEYTEKGSTVATTIQVPKDVYSRYTKDQSIAIQKDGYGRIYLDETAR